jgi:hypothetical protein
MPTLGWPIFSMLHPVKVKEGDRDVEECRQHHRATVDLCGRFRLSAGPGDLWTLMSPNHENHNGKLSVASGRVARGTVLCGSQLLIGLFAKPWELELVRVLFCSFG